MPDAASPDTSPPRASGDGAADRPGLTARLDEPATADALHRLLDRLDAIERSVTALTAAVEQAPLAASTVADAFDEGVRRSEARTGVAFDDRTTAALVLAERLTAPRTADVLGRLLDRLDQVEALVGLADQLPLAASAAADVADEAVRRSEARTGVAFDDRLRGLVRLSERLTAPDTTETLGALLDRIDRLEALTRLADQAPGLVAMLGDIADETVRRAMDSDVDVERAVRQGLGAFVRVGELTASDEFQTLLESGVLDKQAVAIVGQAGRALAATQRESRAAGAVPSTGALGLLKALRDPDVKRALGFLTRFAKHFGQAVDEQRPPEQPM
jgi:hypothetical protein